MLVAQFPKGYTVQMGNPEIGVFGRVIDFKPMIAFLAMIPLAAIAAAFFNCFFAPAYRTLRVAFFSP